ncbi:hypothetical protein [Halosimplex pelagicum]|uniref:Uncharacterized protein n=1 Tax=Halosimplex pelagicum TaxID=869886 RepID=A0A7D5PE74_9EURY|nr:hypothetical protein [Halosimplex pelagicum]QLH81159.1 hypothetical protein HZS54_05670 [Halosimplex pelagicum]
MTLAVGVPSPERAARLSSALAVALLAPDPFADALFAGWVLFLVGLAAVGALAVTHWDAVDLTVLGLLSVCLGGWLVWRQSYVVRVLGSAGT